ncbi:MAG: hypothetical protein Q7S89_00970 [bacterium]|nr:hypothetical protein [bacterium]
MTSQARSLTIAFVVMVAAVVFGIFWSHRDTPKLAAPQVDSSALEKTGELIDDNLKITFHYPNTWRTDQEGDEIKDGKRTRHLLLKDDQSSLLFLANMADPQINEWDIVAAKGNTRVGDLQLPSNPSGDWQRLQSSNPELGGTEVLTLRFDHTGNHYFLLFTYPKKDYQEAAKLFFNIVESFFLG